MLGGRSWDQWIAQYGGSHQHPANRFCHTLGIPLIGVTTLSAMAQQAMAETDHAIGAGLHDARRNEVYLEIAGAVHGQQAEIGFRLNMTEDRQICRRPNHMDTHQQRQKHADEYRAQRQKVILQPNDFVIEAEDVFTNEAAWGCMGVNRVRVVSVGIVSVLGHHDFIVSPPLGLPAICRSLPG